MTPNSKDDAPAPEYPYTRDQHAAWMEAHGVPAAAGPAILALVRRVSELAAEDARNDEEERTEDYLDPDEHKAIVEVEVAKARAEGYQAGWAACHAKMHEGQLLLGF